MKTLIISDIHANLVALEAVLENVSYDRVICLGDIIGYGPQPSECVDIVFDKCDFVVLGNHDENIIHLKEQKETSGSPVSQAKLWNLWTAGQLSEKQLRILRTSDKLIELNEDGLKLLFVHNIHKNMYISEDSSEYIFKGFAEKYPADIVFFGHSHTAFRKQVANTLFINAGSIGQPRHGRVEASYVILENGEVEIHNMKYNTAPVAKSLKTLPLHDEYRSLWNSFLNKAIVDKKQLMEVETRISRVKTEVRNVSC